MGAGVLGQGVETGRKKRGGEHQEKAASFLIRLLVGCSCVGPIWDKYTQKYPCLERQCELTLRPGPLGTQLCSATPRASAPSSWPNSQLVAPALSPLRDPCIS